MMSMNRQWEVPLVPGSQQNTWWSVRAGTQLATACAPFSQNGSVEGELPVPCVDSLIKKSCERPKELSHSTEEAAHVWLGKGQIV
jgi:hypothetical protein